MVFGSSNGNVKPGVKGYSGVSVMYLYADCEL